MFLLGASLAALQLRYILSEAEGQGLQGRAFRYIFFAENFVSKEHLEEQKRMPLQSLSQEHLEVFLNNNP